MINKDAERLELAARLNEALPPKGALSDVEIARHCSISKAGVGAWRKTGRIAKKHLAMLADLSGRPLEWWLSAPGAKATDTSAQHRVAEPPATPYVNAYTVQLASPAVTLDLSADCLVVWQQLQQLPPREREEWRAKLDFAVASARMNKLGLPTTPRALQPDPQAEKPSEAPPPKVQHTD